MRGKLIPVVVREKIEKLLEEGATIPLISERFSISRQTLYKAKWINWEKIKKGNKNGNVENAV